MLEEDGEGDEAMVVEGSPPKLAEGFYELEAIHRRRLNPQGQATVAAGSHKASFLHAAAAAGSGCWGSRGELDLHGCATTPPQYLQREWRKMKGKKKGKNVFSHLT